MEKLSNVYWEHHGQISWEWCSIPQGMIGLRDSHEWVMIKMINDDGNSYRREKWRSLRALLRGFMWLFYVTRRIIWLVVQSLSLKNLRIPKIDDENPQ